MVSKMEATKCNLNSVQVNFLPSLTALDTLFLRQHNSVASQLMVCPRKFIIPISYPGNQQGMVR